MPDSRSEKLAAFVQWSHAHITGDEKGQAQIFLDRLFQAFGHAGALDVGGEAECRIRKGKEDGGGTSFADYVWKPVVLIEMKKRGEKLSKHYRQAFDYWTRLVPGRPRYVVLCNFDEFHVYDFETQMDSPVGAVALADLPEHYGPLNFLFPGQPAPRFENDRVAVTREAADCLADCFKKLRKRGVDQPTAQRFILQILVSLFAEDIDLLPKYFVTELLNEITSPAGSYDLLGGLFTAMNTSPAPVGGRFKGVAYFNGGLFAEPARVELQDLELVALRKAATFDWKKVQPEIFGTLFEHSLDDGKLAGTKNERRATGAHFTHPADIMKIVGPTIVEPWRELIEEAKTVKRLRDLIARLSHFRVLDPACGSGNFLYIAYRELKRLEARLFERLEEESKKEAKHSDQMRLSFLSAQNFYGMDINSFAVEIAKVTMMIARKLAIDELHITERALPLDNLDQNFIAADALVTNDVRTPWPAADVIIGNPPFIGAKFLKPQLGPDKVKTLRRLYPEVPGMADYCVYWIRRAHDHLPPCTKDDPVAGRAGLVGTQNIRNNQSRVGGLDHVVQTGTIIEAVDNQPWSGEANVHVSIANWMKTQDPALVPKTRRLWFKAEPTAAMKNARKKQGKTAAKDYELGFRDATEINSALSDQTDVSAAGPLLCNTAPQRCFNGQMLGHQGFLLTGDQRAEIIKHDSRSAEIIHPYLNGVEVLTLGGAGERFVLDFEQMDQLTAATYPGAFGWVKERVLPDRQKKAEEGKDAEGNLRPHHKAFLSRWWQLGFGRPEMLSVIKPLPRYLACAYVTKRPIFLFISREFRPSNLIQVFGFADDYSFGVLQSHAHWLWFTTKCGKLKSDFRYSAESVFDTFPWPQSPGVRAIKAVAAAGREVRRIRAEALPKMKGGLRALYRTLELPGANPLKDAHAALDAAVLEAYGFSAKGDLLAQLLALNQDVAARIEKGLPVTAPGLPLPADRRSAFITTDCIGSPATDDSTAESYGAAAHFHGVFLREEGSGYSAKSGNAS
ncbi:MAG: N-6 DNA methylase [Verrucomicrobiaceae bacterium]|nr:N-6 DNA methylase [Verrucomicrobiaceae bacterium]